MPKKAKKDFTKSIIRAQQKRMESGNVFSEYAAQSVGDDSKARAKLQSVVERTNLDDFLCNAFLADASFEAERGKAVVVAAEDLRRAEDTPDIEEMYDYQDLKIPRRPQWDESTTPAELDRMEKDSFLAWRRELATIESASKLAITPYEKNLEVWKQLWRVVERSDLLVQIVDARNPLLFRCKDVERYVNEVDPNKKVLVLVNKADFLSEVMRKEWVKYFESQGVRVVFFSAISQQNLDTTSKRNEIETILRNAALKRLGMMEDNNEDDDIHFDDDEEEDETNEIVEVIRALKKEENVVRGSFGFSVLDTGDDDNESSDEETQKEDNQKTKNPDLNQSESESSETENNSSENDSSEEEEPTKNKNLKPKVNLKTVKKVEIVESSSDEETDEDDCEEYKCDATKLLDREELLDFFYSIKDEMGLDRICVGMVGYPNVGKSSTINALISDHRVAVSSTPGKTRHFQTIKLNEEIMLCDCPGLVFPTFMSSKADLICNGILPIDQLKVGDYIAPVAIVCSRISREQFQSTYHVKFPLHLKVTAHMLLEEYAKWRAYWAGGGFVNEAKSARAVLKDFVNGKLIYCNHPPGLSREAVTEFLNSVDKTQVIPEPEYKKLSEQVAVQEYVDDILPKSISRASLKGNTKAKARMRRDRQLGRAEVAAKGNAIEQANVEVHASGGKKKGVNSFRRKEYIPTDLDM